MTEYGYNALGWKLSEVFVGVATNSFTYNEAGDLRTLSDGKSQVTKWGYDTFGRVITKTNAADTEILRYSYHLNGALSNRWSAAKGNTVYSYDAAGNLTNVNYATSSDLIFEYDGLNRPTMMTNVVGKTTWAYDVTNRFSVEDGPWADDAVTNRWNIAGLPESISVDQPSTTNYYWMAYAYDAARRLQTVSGTAGNFANYYVGTLNSIDVPSRLVQQKTLPNTAFITNYYDSFARLTATELRNGSTLANINLHTYSYNLGHQRTNQARFDGSSVDYLYDDVGQLYSAKTYSGGSETTSQRRGYTYDAAWNMIKTTNSTIAFTRTVNNLNQITSDGTYSHTHDGNGNRTIGAQYSVYTFDDENQLTQFYNDPVPFGSGAKRTEFVYDGKGRLRVRKEYFWDASHSVWGSDGETRYIYHGMLCIQERNVANTPTVSYTRGSDLSGSLEGAGGIGGLLARSHGYSSGAWSTHNFYHPDGNGNITAMVNSSQSLVASYKYDPYGNLLTSSGTLASANLYRFSSKLWCANAGLYYYGYRFYDPTLQRWLNRDPIQENGGINLYSFVVNQPTRFMDRWGLAPDLGDWGGHLWPPLQGPNFPSKGNCWRYACGDPAKDGEKPRRRPPGWLDALKPSCPDPCQALMDGINGAGGKPPNPNTGKCPPGTHKISVQYSPDANGGAPDYHFGREWPDGTWSDKQGPMYPRTSGPEPRPGYKKCGETCVPDNWDTDSIGSP